MPHLNNFYDEKTVNDIFDLINRSDEENFYIHDMLINRIQANDIMSRMYATFATCVITLFIVIISAYINNDTVMWMSLAMCICSLFYFILLTQELKENSNELDDLILSKRKREYERFKS